MKNRDVRNVILLTAIYMIIIAIIVGIGDRIYGSEMDWANQHSVIPDYLRNRFYETKELFPSFAFEAGAGQNIYYYAYYGLLSPIIMFSYLLPFVDMQTYIIVANIVLILISVLLFYYFLRFKYSTKVSFLTAILFMTASPLIFHSHRHLMFVNYMPFLIWALIIIHNYFKKKKSLKMLVVASVLIITTSFFFSIGCFIAMGIYSIMLYLEDCEKIKIGECLKKISPIIVAGAVAIMISAIYLLPTACALFSGRNESENTIKSINLIMPSVEATYVLYDTYSMGLSAFSIYAMIAVFFRKKDWSGKFLSSIFILICTLPIVVYLLNGGLYLDAKVLIPFIPLAMILTAEFFKTLFKKEKIVKKVIITATVMNVLLFFTNIKGDYEKLHLIQMIMIAIIFLIYHLKKYTYIICMPVVIMSFVVCVGVNLNDTFVEGDEKIKSNQEKVEKLVNSVLEEEESVYRFGNCVDKWKNVNKVVQAGYLNNTIYSSVSNSHYKDFCFNQMKNEMIVRNNAGVTTSSNILYNIYMGVKYYITESGYIPKGYKIKDRLGDIYLYESSDAFSIGYLTDKTISIEEYDRLTYPENVETLLKYKVTDEKADGAKKDEEADCTVKEITPKMYADTENEYIKKTENGYIINADKEFRMKVAFDELCPNKILFITFDVNNDLGNRSMDVYVQINDVRNKLTKKGWKYHNKNYSFEYTISSEEGEEGLDMLFSKGEYEISNIKLYMLDYSEIEKLKESHDEMIIDKDATMGDIIVGDIDAKKDGWFHLSLPYDEGFKITVDGKEVDYYTSDINFIGFYMEKGKHKIEIEYTAPGYKQGMAVTISGLLMYGIFIFAEKKKWRAV